MATDHLFVYGSLMRAANGAFGRRERERLHRSSTHLGDASIPGRLVDLGDYPGLVLTAVAGEHVHGELVRLTDPDTCLQWLDVYEDIDRRDGNDGAYRRVARPVRQLNGETQLAWLYEWVEAAIEHPPIPGGRWTGTDHS